MGILVSYTNSLYQVYQSGGNKYWQCQMTCFCRCRGDDASLEEFLGNEHGLSLQ